MDSRSLKDLKGICGKKLIMADKFRWCIQTGSKRGEREREMEGGRQIFKREKNASQRNAISPT